MLKKFKPDAIAIAALLTSLTGFYAATWGLLHGLVFARICEAFMSIELYFWLGDDGGAASRHIDQFFYILLLFGSIIYVTSGKKESRLIRFCFGIVFISRVAGVIFGIAMLLDNWKAMTGATGEIFARLLFYASQAFWLWLSYTLLKKIKNSKEFEATEHPYGDGVTYTEYERSSLWHRVFHLVTDQLIIFLQFYGLFVLVLRDGYFRQTIESLAHIFGPKLVVLLIFIFFHLVYFILFEKLFGATPAKLLSESRVITEDGSNASTSAIVTRTISRFVPFEAFSFFGAQGWHDRWSGTTVANERRTGIQGNYYFFIIPGAIGAVLLFNAAVSGIGSFISHSREHEHNGKETAKMEKALKGLSTSNYIETENVQSDYSGRFYYAVEKVNGDRITLVPLSGPPSGKLTQEYVESLIKTGKLDAGDAITLTRDKLYGALNPDGAEPGRPGFKYNGNLYWVTKIVTLYQPNIELVNGQSHASGEFDTEIRNIGWRAVISDIKTIEGNVKMDDRTFQLSSTGGDYYNNNNAATITGKSTGGSTDFKFEFTATDSLDRRQVYRVSGNSGNNVRELELVSP